MGALQVAAPSKDETNATMIWQVDGVQLASG
jgi:hypothetical protein